LKKENNNIKSSKPATVKDAAKVRKTRIRSAKSGTSRAPGSQASTEHPAQHVIPLGNGWMVKGEKSKDITVITDNKKSAIYIATSIAKTSGTELIIHNKKGKMVASRSYAVKAKTSCKKK
jgi:uncharacterized protein YdaT